MEEMIRGRHISKVGSIVLRRNNDSWDVLLGYWRGAVFFPKGHLDHHLPISHARTECVEEVRHYPLTCQGRLLTESYSYWDVDVCCTIDWYLFTTSIAVDFTPVEEYDTETMHRWIPVADLAAEIEADSPPHQLPMNRKIVGRIMNVINS